MPDRDATTAKSALETALSLVGRRELSEQQLRQRLERRAFPGGDIEPAIERLKEYGYIDDGAIADRTLERAIRRRRGPRWLRTDLEARGLSEDDVDRVCQRLAGQQSPLAREALRARFGDLDSLDAAGRRRACRHLANRGYEVDVIEQLLGAPGAAEPDVEPWI